MRIEFPRSAREDFLWTQPQLRIGSAPDNDLVLAASHAAEHHVRIQHDRRGWVLQVLSTAARIHVNARPVRERALLRAGDVVSVGGCRMLLREDEDPLDPGDLDLTMAPKVEPDAAAGQGNADAESAGEVNVAADGPEEK